jgi:hypothetical protein
MSGHISTGLSGDRRAMGASMDPNDRDRHLLEAITKAHTEFVDLVEPTKLFDGLLELLLNITNSEYGFIGEILHSDEGRPYLKTFSITNIAWNKETRKFYEENAPQGMEFHNLKTLFGQVMVTRERIISNHPGTDPRRGGLPEGHPPLNAFLGLPVNSGGSMIGMAGIANRSEPTPSDVRWGKHSRRARYGRVPCLTAPSTQSSRRMTREQSSR